MTMVYRCMTHETSFTTLSDQDLIVEARRLAANERTATATLIACLAELDARLHLGMGYSSLHDYCAKALHLTDYAGYARIEAARPEVAHPLLPATETVTAPIVCAPEPPAAQLDRPPAPTCPDRQPAAALSRAQRL